MVLSKELPSEGTRFSLSGYIGTVRFVGKVDGTDGIWLGVEWDDPQRGKHDGVKDEKRYFTCQIANAGSFIRPSASINFGTSFLRALMAKYIELPQGSTSQEKVLLGSSKGTIEVEVVGLDKVREKLANLQNLREVSLDGQYVATCDPTGEIYKTCPNIRGVDISLSLLPSWDVVALIVAELPLLERLTLNQNRLLPPKDPEYARTAFTKLTELQLNRTMMTWREMQEITVFMPNLRQIEFGYNDLTTLDFSTSVQSTVQVLNLDSNQCRDWFHICQALKPYSVLQRLILTANHIEKITPLPDQSQPLRGLRHLSLSFNRLTSWSDIDALSGWCPAIETLSLMGNPLVEDHDLGRYARQFTVARLPSLVTLDSANISQKERTDCELFYISYIVRNGPLRKEDRNREHPRWKDLCSQHGTPEESTKGKLSKDKLSNRLIDVNIRQALNQPPCTTSSDSVSSSVLRVLSSMSLRTFRLKVGKFIQSKFPIELWLKMGDSSLVKMDNNHDDQDLAWWGVDNNSDVLFYVNITSQSSHVQ